jgi:hypothetical protein
MLCEQHWVGWSGSPTSGIIISGITSATIVFALYRAEVVSKVMSIVRVASSWAWAFVLARTGQLPARVAPETEGNVSTNHMLHLHLNKSNVKLPPIRSHRAVLQTDCSSVT